MILRSTIALTLVGTLASAGARFHPVAPTSLSGADSSIFAPLTISPTPSATRAANGAPGPKYWQNKADYDLQATVDTASGSVQGRMTLRYTNNSPDTLPFLWFQTEQNSFRQANKAPPPYGDIIDQFAEVIDGKPVAVQLEEHQSETKATLPRSLRPGETATFQVSWHFVVPPRSTNSDSVMHDMHRAVMSLRMGRDGTLYRIAQWYPRVNVYDDVKGWNIEPYLGPGEFYLEYGDYTLAVTVPANYIVGATGTLDNPQEVLTAAECARLVRGAHADTIVRIVTAAELADGTAHLRKSGMVTWKFHAANVRDAVFAASPEYQWDVTSWKGIMAHAYYRPYVASTWATAADMARMSIQEYSERWYQYPYPQISVAEGNTTGPVTGGMEYPMMSFNATPDDTVETYSLLTHEIGHNWFPMIVGSNERVHGWMDEGLNTFVNSFSNARRYPSRNQEAQIRRPEASTLAAINAHGGDEYDEPAYALQLLRRDVLGPDVFDKAFRAYIQRWAFKHPTPADFFRTMNDVSGQNLDWFWREWFEELLPLDQALDSVQVTPSGTGKHMRIVYLNKAAAVAPLLVRFTFSDSTIQNFTYPVDIWRHGTTYTASYDFPGKTVAEIRIDPERHFYDADRLNNRWMAK